MGLRLLAALTLSCLCGCATARALSAEERAVLDADAAPAVAALQAARFDAATSLSKDALTRHEDNARAAAVLAVSTWRLALHDLATDALTFAASVATSALMRGDYVNRDFLDFAVKRADGRLAEVDSALARAEKDPGFSLELCLACWEVDWNRNGEVDERDRRLLQVEVDARGEELPDGDPRRRPTFRFDAADVSWLRAMVSFQRAALAVIQAWDVDLSGLATNRLDSLRLKLRDAKEAQRAADLILTGLNHARRCRQEVLAETDDDREWLPNPRQESHALPLEVDDALFDTWAGVLDDVEALLRSQRGLSAAEVAQLGDHQWETPPGGFLDVGALLTHPTDLEIQTEELQRARGRQTPQEMEEALRRTFGPAWKDSMPPSQLPSRLLRMRREVDQGQDTLERKLRYLLWLN
ncbi:MAG: hypothetical protein AB1938_01650 [Myxococcota bacterium]